MKTAECKKVIRHKRQVSILCRQIDLAWSGGRRGSADCPHRTPAHSCKHNCLEWREIKTREIQKGCFKSLPPKPLTPTPSILAFERVQITQYALIHVYTIKRGSFSPLQEVLENFPSHHQTVIKGVGLAEKSLTQTHLGSYLIFKVLTIEEE